MITTPVSKGASCSGFIAEKNDCLVRAIANAASIPYSQAHEICSRNGRVNGSGAFFETVIASATEAGFELSGVFGTTGSAMWYKRNQKNITHYKGMCLKHGIQYFSQGRYLIHIRGHILAVVNGKVIDTHAAPEKKSICAVYKYTK